MKWISGLFRRIRKPAPKEKFSCVYSLAERNVRLDVLEYLLPCGHRAYSVHGEFYVEEMQQWITVIDLRDYNMNAASEMLCKAVEAVSAFEHGLVAVPE
jgi:hypothetical protein